MKRAFPSPHLFMYSFIFFRPCGLRDSSSIQRVLIHCYCYLMLKQHDLISSLWELGDVIRDVQIFTCGPAATSTGLCFLTLKPRLCPWEQCCPCSTLLVQWPCWGDRSPHTVSPSPDFCTSLPSPMWMGLPSSVEGRLTSSFWGSSVGRQGGLLPNLWNGSIYWNVCGHDTPGTLGADHF